MKRILAVTAASVLLASPAVARPLDVGVSAEATAAWSQDRAMRVSRSAVEPTGTTRGPTRAVAYLLELAEARAGGYWDQCLRLADDAYMPRGPRVHSAMAQWQRAKQAGVAHPKDPAPPIGAQMFWDPGHASGHIATYVGDGKAVTNMPDGTVKAIKWREMNDWGPYLGWAQPYYK